MQSYITKLFSTHLVCDAAVHTQVAFCKHVFNVDETVKPEIHLHACMPDKTAAFNCN